jgi:phage shock protein PspC (stress-responsive transcriptional regulator)
MKKLYRHHKDTHGTPVVSGIFSGLGEWMEVSPGVLRVGYIVLAIITGILPAVFLYLIFHFLIPKQR